MLEKLISSSIVELAINRALQFDPDAIEKLTTLDGKRMSLQLDFLPTPWAFKIQDGLIVMSEAENEQADVQLSGTLGGFLQLFKKETLPHSSDKLFISGDLRTAQLFQQVMGEIKPDFQGVLRQRFGDKMGGFLADSLSQLQLKGDVFRHKMETQIYNYASENSLNKATFEVTNYRLQQLASSLSHIETRLTALEDQ